MAGQTFGTATTAPAINLLRIEESLSAAHLRLAGGTYIEQLDWAECVDRYDRPHSLFYLDPPVLGNGRVWRALQWAQYELMAAKLKAIQGKAIVSINDHPAIREVLRGVRDGGADPRLHRGRRRQPRRAR